MLCNSITMQMLNAKMLLLRQNIKWRCNTTSFIEKLLTSSTVIQPSSRNSCKNNNTYFHYKKYALCLMIISCGKRNFYSVNYNNRYQGDNQQMKTRHAAFQNTMIVLFFWFFLIKFNKLWLIFLNILDFLLYAWISVHSEIISINSTTCNSWNILFPTLMCHKLYWDQQ